MNVLQKAPVQQEPSTADTLLATVIMKLHDTMRLFDDLAQRSNIPAVQQHALSQVEQRDRFVTELKAQLQGPAREVSDGSFNGLFLRVTKDLKSLLPSAEPKMLNTADEGETALRAAYYLALEHNSASSELREMLQRQQAHVSRSQALLRSFRDQL